MRDKPPSEEDLKEMFSVLVKMHKVIWDEVAAEFHDLSKEERMEVFKQISRFAVQGMLSHAASGMED